MAGSQEPGRLVCLGRHLRRDGSSDYAVLPLAVRIEAQHDRLVSVPDTITDPNASAQFKFNLDAVARVDLLDPLRPTRKRPRRLDDAPRGPRQGGQAAPAGRRPALHAAADGPARDLGKTKATEPLDTQPAGRSSPMTKEYEVRSSELWDEEVRFTILDDGNGFTMDGPMALYEQPSRLLSRSRPRGASAAQLAKFGKRQFREIIEPGAFTKSLNENPRHRPALPARREHPAARPDEGRHAAAHEEDEWSGPGRPSRQRVGPADARRGEARRHRRHLVPHGRVIESWEQETLADGYDRPGPPSHEIQLRREVSLVTFPGYDTPGSSASSRRRPRSIPTPCLGACKASSPRHGSRRAARRSSPSSTSTRTCPCWAPTRLKADPDAGAAARPRRVIHPPPTAIRRSDRRTPRRAPRDHSHHVKGRASDKRFYLT
jgi:hypothetical protein